MSEDEIIERVNKFINITVLYGKTYGMTCDDLKKYQQVFQGLLDLYNKEKEKNKELEKEMELNKEAIYLANNTICNYDIGYQDGLNKKMTATEIVAEQRKFMILGQKINQLENANYELHKKIDEGNKKVVENYISKDKIKERIKTIKEIYEREMKPYQTEYGLNVSLLSKKEKDELIGKRNGLLLQIAAYESLLEED